MNTTRLAAAVLLLAGPSFAEIPSLPRPVALRTGSLPSPLRDPAAWRAWPTGDAASLGALDLRQTTSPSWVQTTVTDPLGAPRAWTFLAEAPGLVALAQASPSGFVAGAPHLLELPAPRPTPVAGGVRLTWDAPDVPGVAGWQLLRSHDGSEFVVALQAGAAAREVIDAAPPGAWTWQLKPVLADGVVPAVSSAPSEVAWSSSGDRDGDGVPDGIDKCASVAAPSQADADRDGLSDACDFAWADVAPRGAPDGRVDVSDVVVLMRFSVGLESPGARELRAGDVAPALVLPRAPQQATPLLAQDGIAIGDAVLALRAAVGLVQIQPAR